MKQKTVFHAVRHAYNDQFTTYSIYVNNRPYLTPGRGYVLGRREAYAIVRLLNHGPWT